MEDFNNALEKDPRDPTIYFNRGNVFLNWEPEQRFKEAHNDYDLALEISPTNAKLWHSKGLAYQGQAEQVYKERDEQDMNLINQAIEMYK